MLVTGTGVIVYVLSRMLAFLFAPSYLLIFWCSEPEAAAVHCAHLTDLHKLQPSQNFMICDAGGGTVVCLAIPKLILFHSLIFSGPRCL
jgi:hypothetical protein